MGVWSHIILEGYCSFNWASNKIWKGRTIEFNEKGKIDLNKKGKEIIHKNKNYIPKSKRPKWCKEKNKKRIPQFDCLCDNKDKKCPFFAMCEADKKDYNLFYKVWKKQVDKELKGGKLK